MKASEGGRHWRGWGWSWNRPELFLPSSLWRVCSCQHQTGLLASRTRSKPPSLWSLVKGAAGKNTELTLATTILTAPAGPEKVRTPLHHTPLVCVGQQRPGLAAFWSGWLRRGGQRSSLGSSCRGSSPSKLPGSTEAAEFWGLAGAPGNSTQSLLLLDALQ